MTKKAQEETIIDVLNGIIEEEEAEKIRASYPQNDAFLINRNSAYYYGRMDRCVKTSDMPRISRAVTMGFPHHVTQRGNYQ